MITKSDWESVRQQMADEDRRTLGEAPATEEILAYGRQELPEADADRVRAWLIGNPEVARALVQPFPSDHAKLGDDDFLPQAELTSAWASVQARVRPAGAPRGLKFPERWLAVAAMVALAFAGLFWQAESKARRYGRELHMPRVLPVPQQLAPDGTRGVSRPSRPIVAAGSDVLLDLPLSHLSESKFAEYRIKIADERTIPVRKLWESAPVRPGEEARLSVLIPGAVLKPGKYRIVVYGVKDGREEALDSYTVPVR